MTQFWRLTCIGTNELHGICKNKETIEWRQIYTWWCRREHSRRWLRCKKKKKLNCELLNCVHARHCFIHSFSTNSPASFNISNLQNMIFFLFPLFLLLLFLVLQVRYWTHSQSHMTFVRLELPFRGLSHNMQPLLPLLSWRESGRSDGALTMQPCTVNFYMPLPGG